jgi:hypothetical protein
MTTRGSSAEVLHTSHKYRCIFIHVPKVAGTSIEQAFEMTGRGHLPWYFYADGYPEYWNAYTTFTAVRNPWDRLVSAYRHAVMKNSHWHSAGGGLHPDYELLADKSLADCLELLVHQRERLTHDAWHPQTTWVAGPRSGGRVMVEHVLRYEQLAGDFAALCRQLGVEPRPLLTLNRSKRSRDYRQYFDDRTRRLVEQLYAADIETFGYAF